MGLSRRGRVIGATLSGAAAARAWQKDRNRHTPEPKQRDTFYWRHDAFMMTDMLIHVKHEPFFVEFFAFADPFLGEPRRS